jgi:hypothetical protein
VPFPIGDCPELIFFKPAFRRGGPASGHELVDEFPVWYLNPVAVQNIAHGRALEPMAAQPFQGGIARLTSPLAQLVQVIDKTLRDAVPTTFHELSLTAPPANDSKPARTMDSNPSGILRTLLESGSPSRNYREGRQGAQRASVFPQVKAIY